MRRSSFTVGLVLPGGGFALLPWLSEQLRMQPPSLLALLGCANTAGEPGAAIEVLAGLGVNGCRWTQTEHHESIEWWNLE